MRFFEGVRTILVIDWPSREVPESLARAGYRVVVKGGPGPENFSEYVSHDGSIDVRRVGRAPDRAELVYSHRPLAELPGIIAMAKSLGAKTLWTQSGRLPDGSKDPRGCWVPPDDLRQAREMVEAAGLTYVSEPYIVEL